MAKKRDSLWIWPGRFTQSLVLVGAIIFAALFSSRISGAGILMLGSLVASSIIITHRHRHHLVTLGTIIFSYVIASIIAVGLAMGLVVLRAPFESQVIISIVIIVAALHWLDLYHAPALAFAIAFLGFGWGVEKYLLVLGAFILIFIIIRLFIYTFYEHLSFRHFVHEFIKEEEKLAIREEKIIKKKLKKSKR